MKKVIFIALIFVFSSFALSSAQMAEDAELQSIRENAMSLEPASKPFSLIDLSRLHWNHSYSFSYFSGGGSSGTLGLYTGTILYEISSNLTLNLKLGIAHNPGAMFDREQGSDAVFLPGARLDYQPSENFRITAGFDTYYGNYYNPFNYYYSPWRY